MMWTVLEEKVAFFILRLVLLFVLTFLFSLLFVICVNGTQVLSISFLTEFPKCGMTKGGVYPALIGTFYLSIGSLLFAFPLGVLAGIYLEEYAGETWFTYLIRACVNTLAGVPSVVFGLFGMAFFVKRLGFGVSLLSGILTLGILILPVIIRTTEEALSSVPADLKEAAYALGATKWRMIKTVVIPMAFPGILTGAILSLGRAAGETAPIMFTAAAFYCRHTPRSVFDEVMALPYLIYGLMTEGTKPEYQVPIAFGAALVLLLLVLGISGIGIFLRYRSRKIR